MLSGLSVKTLSCTRTFCVFHRQSLRYGWVVIVVALQVFADTTDGFTRVPDPLLVLAGDPANRSAFSQSTTPAQLSVKTLPLISKVWLNTPGARGSLPDSEMYSAGVGKPAFSGPFPRPLRTKELPR